MSHNNGNELSLDLETALIRGGNIDSYQIAKIVDEIDKNLVKQVAINPRQLILPFHKLCLKILDRLFGEDTTTGHGISFPAPWIKGPPGGWLRRLINQDVRGYSDSRFQNNQSNSHKSRVVECFSPRSNLLDIMFTKNRNGNIGTNYEIKLSFFSQKIRMALNNNPLYPCLKSDNHDVYFYLFQTPFQEQIQHINSKVKDPTVLLEPIEYFLICLIRYSVAGGPPVLTPLSFINSPQGHTNKFPTHIGVEAWIQPFPYLVLLREYIRELIPHNLMVPSLSGEINPLSQVKYLFIMLVTEFWFDSTMIVRQNHRILNQLYRNSSGSMNHTPGHESFHHPLPTDVIVLEGGFSVRSMASMQCVYLLLVHILSDPSISKQYKSSLDIALDDLKKNGGSINDYSANTDFYLPARHRSSRENRPTSQQDLKALKHTYLPLNLRFLQQPLFDMLRAMLSRTDSNSSDESMFHMAIQIWLLYICPWKCPSAYKYGIDRASEKYISKDWRCYVAANLHFYTTLTAIVFKSISRTDFSIQTPDDQSKLNVLEKVLGVLVQDGLWNDIEFLTNSFSHSYSSILLNPLSVVIESSPRYNIDSFRSNDSLANFPSSSELNAMRAQHQLLFPDRTIDNLEDYGIVDARVYSKETAKVIVDSLALAIFRLEIKKGVPVEGNLFWRTWCSIYTWFTSSGGSDFPETLGDDICRRCRQIMNQLSALMGVDVSNALNPVATGYLDINRGNRIRGSQEDIRDRITKKLTSHGKAKLLVGALRINPTNLEWMCVDALTKPIASYEIHWLAKFFIKVSKDLNEIFDLPVDKKQIFITWDVLARDVFSDWRNGLSIIRSSMRINLRFLSNIWYQSSIGLFFLGVLSFWGVLHPLWLMTGIGFATAAIAMFA